MKNWINVDKVLNNFKKKKFLMVVFCFGLAFFLLLLCSKCSFLYSFNGWDDFNSFYTVASGWANGLIPYRDLFEQKGPFLYFIFLIGYFISPGKFIGIFTLEVIFFWLTLYVSSKIVDMFIDENKYPMGKYLILLLYAIMMTTSVSFVEGGSSEEFNLLFTTITVFYIIKYLKNGDLVDISYKDLVICAICCGLSLMIKYTTIGLWFIMMAYICIKLIKFKRYKEAVLKGLIFIVMMMIPFGVFSVYFYLNDSLFDFLETYFYINIFKYSSDGGFLSNIWLVITNIFSAFFSNFVLVAAFYCMFCYYLRKIMKESYKLKLMKKQRLFFSIILFFLIVLYYSQTFRVYAFTAAFFIVLLIIIHLYTIFNKYRAFKISCLIYIFIALITAIDFEYMNARKEDIVQYRFANIINNYENPTLLHYRSIDEGFYTAAKILPNKRYFEQVNISFDRLSSSYNEQDSAIINKEVMFVVVRKFDLEKKSRFMDLNENSKVIFNERADLDFISIYYDLVDVYENKIGYYDTCIYYLYKAKE